ncbi:MAG: hypothetical protein WC087_03020 [Candidatus Paceibacterota bacterium]
MYRVQLNLFANGLWYYNIVDVKRNAVPRVGETIKVMFSSINSRGSGFNTTVRLMVTEVEHNILLSVPEFELVEVRVIPHPTSTNYHRILNKKTGYKRLPH